MRNPGKGRLLTFEPSSGNWRKNLGTDIRNGSVKRYPIIGIPFGLRPHSIPIMGNDTVNGILPLTNKNIKDFHLELYDIFEIFRFKKVEYKWYRGADVYPSFEMYKGKDSDLVISGK